MINKGINSIILNKRIFLLLGFTSLILGACVQFKTASLYDGVEPEEKPVKPKSISLVVEPEIYDDSTRDMWGIEKDVCKNVSISTDVAYNNSSQSILLEWDRNNPGCTWAGIGIGWDGYAGKDLTEIMDYAAFEFYVRTKEGRSFGLPFVLTLEDYSGGMGFCYTSNKYFERTAIDESWQKVIVPLKDFDLETENLDITNIKQLQIELQQSGQVYLDDIKLVFYEPEPVEPWMVEEKLPDPTAMPIVIFEDEFINNNSFGFVDIDCQTVSTELSPEGTVIHAVWNMKEDCRESSFGGSWNKWNPVDISKVSGTAAFQFDLKVVAPKSDLPLKIGFEDYDRARTDIQIKAKYSTSGNYSNDWETYSVPIADIPPSVNFERIKMFYFGFDKAGEVYIDNIRLVNYPQ